jgi:hypothetical protein
MNSENVKDDNKELLQTAILNFLFKKVGEIE